MPQFQDKRTREAQLLLDSVLKDVEIDTHLQLDSVSTMVEQIATLGENNGEMLIRQAVLDGAKSYQQIHGTNPPADVVALALDHANIILDNAIAEASSQGSNERSLVPNSVLVAIRAMIATSIPFAHYVSADKQSGEAPIVIVSHKTANKNGMYNDNSLLDGVVGGNTFISPTRTHKLSSDGGNTSFSGKITAIMTSRTECDQSATIPPLYEQRTQILVNGLIAVTTEKSSSGSTERTSGFIHLDNRDITIDANVNLKTGEVTVTFGEALPENTIVLARGFVNYEAMTDTQRTELTPTVKTEAKKYTMFAKPYRAKTIATPEAIRQFQKEIGIDPTFEGTMAIRQQFAQEMHYEALSELTLIAQQIGAETFDFKWDTQGVEKTQADIAQDLLAFIRGVDQKIIERNGSHGVSHIYVDNTLATIISSLGSVYFETADTQPRPGIYRLGRLMGRYDVYYTPKGIKDNDIKGARMLLIGANASNPAFNPFVIGEAYAPEVKPVSANANSPDEGFWVLGKNFAQQNPVAMYASSVAVVDVLNTAYVIKNHAQ